MKTLILRNSVSVVCQRLIAKTSCTQDEVEKSNDEIITLEHKDRIKYTDIERPMSGHEFKEICQKAMRECETKILTFYFIEKFSNVSIAFMSIFSVFLENYGLRQIAIVILCSLIFLVYLLQEFGDWGRLREKYSMLYRKFKKLFFSVKENREEKFDKYMELFNSNELSIDSYPIRPFAICCRR